MVVIKVSSFMFRGDVERTLSCPQTKDTCDTTMCMKWINMSEFCHQFCDHNSKNCFSTGVCEIADCSIEEMEDYGTCTL